MSMLSLAGTRQMLLKSGWVNEIFMNPGVVYMTIVVNLRVLICNCKAVGLVNIVTTDFNPLIKSKS
jgi:hypothetical protein